jgi:site-specific DNA-methyltransferase (adenine-specific)/site-specific DNA-methyltransferase (cytosine-N4-specific)
MAKTSVTKKGNVSAKVVNSDCIAFLKTLPDDSVDLVITSPPYADQRSSTYGGVKADAYVDWFTPISSEILRVLKPTGSFVLNIKEKVVNGERHTYVIELILALRKQGWLWTEEYIWNKKNSFPGKWPNRFRDGWERVLHFNKQKDFKMNQDAVKIPIGGWSKSRLSNLSDKDKERDNSQVGSGFGKNVSNWVGKETVYPNNVINLATESSNKNHSAVYPLGLPEWFIKLFTDEGDVVLDPFLGSGTTCVAALNLNRNSIGTEILEDYYKVAVKRIRESV